MPFMLAVAGTGLVGLALSNAMRQAMARALVLRMRTTVLSNSTTPWLNASRARRCFTGIVRLR